MGSGSVPTGDGQRPRRRKSAEDRKAELVQAAIRLAARTGPDRVTARDLAREVGLTQPAVFRHFPTMSAIWSEVATFITGRLSREQVDPGADPVAALEHAIEAQLAFVARTPAIPAILFSRELHVENEEMRRHFESLMAKRRADFAQLVAAGQAAGQLRTGLDASDLSALILATIQGLAMRWSLENRAFDLRQEGMRLIRTLLDAARVR